MSDLGQMVNNARVERIFIDEKGNAVLIIKAQNEFYHTYSNKISQFLVDSKVREIGDEFWINPDILDRAKEEPGDIELEGAKWL